MNHSLLLWGTLVLIGAGTLALRGAGFFALPAGELPRWFDRALRLSPAAIFSALIAPAVLGSSTTGMTDPHLLAAALAALIAWRSRNMLLTIAGGMVALWSLTWWLG